MTSSVLVVDYDPARRTFVKEMVQNVFPKSRVEEEKAASQEQEKRANFARASELAGKEFDLVVYNTLSNPPPKLFIEKFKKNSPKSRVLLYTDLTTLSVGDFNEYRHADGMMIIHFPGDTSNAERIKSIQKTIEECDRASPSVALEWLPPVAKGFSGVVVALASIVSAVAGAYGAYVTNVGTLTP